ncbi:MAG: branched-chain amino acid ABC transporter permease [Candidatus Tectomicrobia bacterium]|nr:branched-chain amino acid ABC transporter permease [Candidatus Tectomicrobia bacterium]
MTLYVQAILNGILVGGVYGLVAIGLSLIFGVMKIINFAHGEMLVLAMYLSFFLFTLLGIDPYMSLFVCAVAAFILGYGVQRFLVNRILHVPEEMQVLLMLGVALVLQNATLVAWGPNFRAAQTRYSLSTVWLGPLVMDVPRLVAFVLALALALLLYLFLRRTELGTTIRAAADNRDGAVLIGLDVRRIYAFSFGLGAACVGAAGSIILPFLPMSPYSALSFTLTSFIVVILGGMGSFLGVLVGGLFVGVAENLGAVVLTSSSKYIFSYALLILVMVLRPQGIFRGRSG